MDVDGFGQRQQNKTYVTGGGRREYHDAARASLRGFTITLDMSELIIIRRKQKLSDLITHTR
jgi:hypothetical protein